MTFPDIRALLRSLFDARPSFGRWLTLSILLHVWFVLLLGNADEGGGARGLRSQRGLTVSIAKSPMRAERTTPTAEPARKTPTKRGKKGAPKRSRPAPTAAAQDVATSAPPKTEPTPTPTASRPPDLPAIAVNVDKAVSTFVIPRAEPLHPLPELARATAVASELPPVTTSAPAETAPAVSFAPLAPLASEPDAATVTKVPVAPLPLPAPIATTNTPIPAARLTPMQIDTDVRVAVPVPVLPAIRELPSDALPGPTATVSAARMPALAPIQEAERAAAAVDRRLPELAPVELAPRAPIAAVPSLGTESPAPALTRAEPGAGSAPTEVRAVPTRAGEGAATTTTAQGAAATTARTDALPDNPFLPPPTTEGKKPALDLDAIRARARAVAGEGTGPRALIAFPTAPKEALKTKEQKIFDKALQRKDCKDAYADLGLAAVVPLVVDTVKGDGCKW